MSIAEETVSLFLRCRTMPGLCWPLSGWRDIALRNRKDVPHKVYEPLARRVARHSWECHFFVRHRPLPWRGFASRRRNRVLAGQFLVCQPTTEDGAHSLNKTLGIATLALVISARLLVEVAEQRKRLHAHIGALETPLQERPEILDAISMYVAFNVPLGMVHELMNVVFLKPGVGRQFISEYFGTRRDVG